MDSIPALAMAQELGYAEVDPSDDIQGNDSAYKLSILATLAFHSRVRPEDVYCEGISQLDIRDFRYAKELGYSIKLLAIAKKKVGELEVRVHPALIPDTHLLARVTGVYNAVEIEGQLLGRILLHGEGAGSEPTTSAVLGDLLEVGKHILHGDSTKRDIFLGDPLAIRDMGDLETSYYFRLNVVDMSGVLASITRVFGDLDISIASVIQKDADRNVGTAELVTVSYTHLTLPTILLV